VIRGLEAFIVNRVGDAGSVIGLCPSSLGTGVAGSEIEQTPPTKGLGLFLFCVPLTTGRAARQEIDQHHHPNSDANEDDGGDRNRD
jgi:hypothetical protein